MANASVKVAQAISGDRSIDNEEISDGSGGFVYRQRVQVGGDGLAEIAEVQNTAPAGTEQGLVVRPIPSGTQTVSGTVTVQDGGGSVTVDGTVGVNNFPAVQPVSDNGGSLTVDGTVAVSNFPATQAVSGPLTDTQLRASAVQVKDDYQTGELLADQSGAGGVLTFTFSTAQSMVVIQSVGANLVSRADPFGGTPSSTLGIRCDDGVPVYIPVQTSSVKVFAPSGTTVTVYGLRRS